MISLLVDCNMDGQALLLWDTIIAEGWHDLFPVQMFRFIDVHLDPAANDRIVWRFAQSRHMILLTNNRNDEGKDSLERTIRQENTPVSFPVITISDLSRMNERIYREKCAERLFEILIDIENHLGTARIFIP